MENKSTKIIFLLILIAFIFMGINYSNIEKLMYPKKYSTLIESYAQENSLDPLLVYSVIKTESKFNPDALSNKGAKGLMQITDTTGEWAAEILNIKKLDLYDPETNIKIGTWYLNRLNKEFNGNLHLVIAAYNGGSGNVRKWLEKDELSEDGQNLKAIPFKETSDYTEKVINSYKNYKRIYNK